ncbi:ATPase [Streptomyces lycii]|uniref:ATPase n=1 Tax=Streptomyces lycii TaxID=2654337 RepID=A0ABQ7FMW3_9ACTN|nr:BadF/BadG/BcrA/BcrD ATPase family protein [Streptomyces lycii]KAF4409724.1 ATPase [Streptomyces lycii]
MPGVSADGGARDDAWVCGVDSGGSGLRVAIARAADGTEADSLRCAEPVRTGPAGIDAGHLLAQLLPAVRTLLGRTAGGAPELAALAVGAAGMATLGGELRTVLPGALASAFGLRRIALAADAVTAYAGALGQRPGVVVAAGTGMIALGADPGAAPGTGPGGSSGGREPGSGTDPGSGAEPGNGTDPGSRTEPGSGTDPGSRTEPGGPSGRPVSGWRRADGWGHLLGDCGGGAWIGRAGLEAALREFDGRGGGSPALLARLEAVFGPPAGLPGLLYPRTDRAAVLASFAPEVGRCAEDDPVSAGILRSAARAVAETAAAVCPPVDGCPVALAGGLFRMGEPLLAPLREELAAVLPAARPEQAAGGPLEGALCIASALATGRLRLPVDGRMLHLPDAAPSQG